MENELLVYNKCFRNSHNYITYIEIMEKRGWKLALKQSYGPCYVAHNIEIKHNFKFVRI